MIDKLIQNYLKAGGFMLEHLQDVDIARQPSGLFNDSQAVLRWANGIAAKNYLQGLEHARDAVEYVEKAQFPEKEVQSLKNISLQDDLLSLVNTQDLKTVLNYLGIIK